MAESTLDTATGERGLTVHIPKFLFGFLAGSVVGSRHERSGLGDCQIARRACGSEARAAWAEAGLAQVRAVVTTSEAMIRHLKLEIAKLRRAQYGQSSERRARLIEQMELELEELRLI